MSETETKTAKAVEKTARKVAQHSQQIADSASDLQHSSERVESSAERTTQLAADRNVLAAERTYAAWMRTGLFAFASGAGANALLTNVLPLWLINLDAVVLLLSSVFCYVAAVWRQTQSRPSYPLPDLKRIPYRMLAAISAFLIFISLATLAGILLARS